MKPAIFLTAAAITLTGCSTSLKLTSAEDANNKIGTSTATLNLKSGVKYRGSNVHVANDSISFVDQGSDSLRCLPVREISSIGVTHRGGGMMEGLFFGGLGGVAWGALLPLGRGEGRGYGMLGAGMLGAAGGLVIGLIKGHDYTLTFPPDSSLSFLHISAKEGMFSPVNDRATRGRE